ncbi:MAG: hypothetical protein AAGI28_13810, partial [Pseudomonadota bacterium]
MRHIRFMIWAAALLAGSQAHAQSRASAELYDYLVQDVCLDDAGEVVKGDPAKCTSKRNIQLGEPSPYIVTDWDTATRVSYAAWNSIPVRGEDGNTRVIVSKSLLGKYDANYTFTYNEAVDGYDLIDLNYSSYASIIRTSDGGCLDQVFAPRLARNLARGTRFNRRRAFSRSLLNSPKARAGGWILFPFAAVPSEWPQTNS